MKHSKVFDFQRNCAIMLDAIRGASFLNGKGLIYDKVNLLSRMEACIMEKSIAKPAFSPRMEVFDPFKVPFSEKTELVFDERDLDACCACTACSACSACQ